ncbi:uncharacterized protein LOC143286467 [Babylonia areolata]|uniref:uncharacterized protein LOC143286467 n=1 Tax=Babylonia areolata TaxID=304850 RepID=UPI003FD3B57B
MFQTGRLAFWAVLVGLFYAVSCWPGNITMRFIVTVNATWDPLNPDNSTDCLSTVATPFLDSSRSINETQPITVGTCDQGALVFGVSNGSQHGYGKMEVYITFFSTKYNYIPPLVCYIPWNGTYLNPTPGKMDRSPLPSCFVTGTVPDPAKKITHTIDYWFRVMDWEM